MSPRPLERVAVNAAILAGVAFALYPLLWVVATALSPEGIAGAGALPLPRHASDAAFRALFAKGWLFALQISSSLVVALLTAALSVVVATPAAWAMARMRFAGRDAGARALLATQMFPTVASAVPLYLLLETFHLLDSRAGLVLVYTGTAVPFAIFQLRGAFEAIPVDLEEAAMVDGATRFQAFVRVALPAARPAIAVTALFAFMAAYNEFIMAATLLSRQSAYTLPVVLQGYVTEHRTEWGPFAAGAILVSVPVMALFYVAQRQLVAGLTAGGVKG